MAFTKENLIASIVETGTTKKKAAEMVETMLETIKQSLENGEDVLISGFGKFCVKEKRGRRGRNPQSGDQIFLAERRVVTFRCSKVLRERLNGKVD